LIHRERGVCFDVKMLKMLCHRQVLPVAESEIRRKTG
jgi:hypothetical protein